MATSQESLFSLELVVEKLYLPYVACRFPAVAFRLLDFPTILISHVEPELADSIHRKINRDPYYKLPNQFSELQDRHGNFMVKKGKSCLFKISLDTLSMHLSNTPMYIMVIDEYPEVPKLLGNSSLAFNEVMDSIKHDIKQNGHTVPSVHGDKGLFKIYNLMGKEIGYMILGFRLLSLGPGLIAHLPATAIVHRASERKNEAPMSVVDEVIEVKQERVLHGASKSVLSKDKNKEREKNDARLNSTREMGSMTDVEKCDALMQTVDMADEKFHIAVSSSNTEVKKQGKTIETQTEHLARKRRVEKTVEEFVIKTEASDESDDGLLLNPNIICPPPLFYNSKAEPDVKIERDSGSSSYRGYESTFDDATLEDLSGDEHFEPIDAKQENRTERSDIPPTRMIQDIPQLHDAKTVVISNVKGAHEKNQMVAPNLNLNFGALNPSEPVFPILTALLTELSKIQNPQFISQAVNQVQQASTAVEQVKKPIDSRKNVKKGTSEPNLSDIKEEEEKEANVSTKKRGKKSHKTCAHPSDGVPKQKGWIRKAPEVAVKKTKLVFGMTNTQRLRLAKQNPTWLKTAEQDERIAKAQRQKPSKTQEFDHDLDTGNLSDTYTEVRRLAAAELEKSTMGQTAITEHSKVKKYKKKATKSRESSPAKSKQSRARSKSPSKGQRGGKKETGKMDLGQESGDEVLDLDPDAQHIESPDLAKGDRLDSAADSIPSSRIEVHIPSARANESDTDDTFSDSFEEVTMSTDRRVRESKFPGFNKGDDSLDPIPPEGTTSMNSTGDFDEDSPMESTRVSKQFRTVPRTGESLFKSTEDYDTKQFQSTDEPELQKLMSEDEKTETLITPATDRTSRSQSPVPTGVTNSTRLSMKFEVINPKASQNSPLPAMRRSQQLKIDSINARPTPTETTTPRSRSSRGTPSPRPRKPFHERRLDFKKESIHTESVSSYVPSESENILSLISDGSYSDDFHASSDKDISSRLSTPEFPKLIPSTKLGFTIH